MKLMTRIALSLSLFLAVAGVVLAVSAQEWRGTVLLLVCAVATSYIGLVLRGAVRRASVPVTPETMAPEQFAVESEVLGGSIWPFVFSIAAVFLVVGVVGFRWVLIPAGVLFVGAGAGWFLDIKRQWHAGERAASHAAEGGPPSGLEQEQQPGQHDDRH
jgi:hypothetical protein